MEILSANDFFEKLNSNKLQSEFIIEGVAKKSDNESEIMFAGKPDFSAWVKIPVTLIDSVIVLKSISGREGTSAYVKLYLKQTVKREAKALYDQIAGLNAEEYYGCMFHHNFCDHEKCEHKYACGVHCSNPHHQSTAVKGNDLHEHGNEKFGHRFRYGYYLPII